MLSFVIAACTAFAPAPRLVAPLDLPLGAHRLSQAPSLSEGSKVFTGAEPWDGDKATLDECGRAH
jgi:hypothetical protein